MRGGYMGKYEKGKIVRGTVSGIEKYGIFVKFDEFYSGLIHISEISNGYVRDPNNFVKIGDIINVEILEIDEPAGQLKLSIKNITYKEKQPKKRKKIVETSLGFKTLAYHLPLWIEENLENTRNSKNFY